MHVICKPVVVVSNLQLDIIHRLRAQAAVLEEQEELADLIELKTCTICCFIQTCFKLNAVLSQRNSAPRDVEEELESLGRKILILLSKRCFQG